MSTELRKYLFRSSISLSHLNNAIWSGVIGTTGITGVFSPIAGVPTGVTPPGVIIEGVMAPLGVNPDGVAPPINTASVQVLVSVNR